ncbi:unnamed protein product [Orchesella dallaii]|uniref:Gustatory receptor n=1 Tax=Orchesella dallaii TaxID=48710 RepID=A0ABP1Q1I1_9HEXA
MGFRETETATRTAEQAVTNLLLLPLRINQTFGAFPLALDKSKLTLNTSWKNYTLTFIVSTFIILSRFSFYTLSFQDLQTVYRISGSTETFISNAANNLSSAFDLICLYTFFKNRYKIQSFYTSYLKHVIRLLSTNYSYCAEEEKILRGETKKLKIVIGITIAMLLSVAINGVTFYCGRAIQSELNIRKVVTFFILTLYWMTINHIRLLTFYLWIAFIISFKVSFRALGILMRPRPNESNICITANRVFWVLKEYQEIQVYLKEFHALFGAQLVNLCFTAVVPLGNVVFQVVKCFREDGIETWELSTLASLVPYILSGMTTFFILCDAATSMTTEATNCMYNLRQIPCISEMPVDKQQNILLFYTLTISKPPRISPGSFFYLGRHILSPVLGLITTYMIVILQFRSQE